MQNERPFFIVLCFFILLLHINCSSKKEQISIRVSANATITEKITAEDLKADLEKVVDIPIQIISQNTAPTDGIQFILGTSNSSELQQILAKNNIKNPGSRGGIWHQLNAQTILLAGGDVQGMQYAVYDYTKNVLDIDPLQYWTGHQAKKITKEKLFEFENQTIPAPTVPLLIYFENDVDELANLKKPLLEYDWESYTEMIDALVRMRYNGIELFDMLGRPEFFLRPSYQKIRPDYKIDLSYIEKMIDYAQSKGMKVQINMSLGYKIKSLDPSYADCWTQHKDKWLAIWQYYLKESPIGKADIFAFRPRHQIWDWEYESNCGEDKTTVFNEVMASLDTLVSTHNPDATKVLICYADGMEMFNNGLNPPKDWIIAWSDDGYADFKYYPNSTKGYTFGTYMHAGFWKNHTVAHPYPEQIETIMKKMFDEYEATGYCEVNGQQFRPFLLNLEAFSEVCYNPQTFTGQAFYEKWASRYFEEQSAKKVIDMMQLWDKASFGKAGYVQNLWEIREAIAYLSMQPIERPGKSPIAYEAQKVDNDLDNLKKRITLLEKAHRKAKAFLQKNDSDYFFHDQIYLPIQLYMDLLTFEDLLHQLYVVKRAYEQNPSNALRLSAIDLLKKTKEQLTIVYENRMKGDKNPHWEGWYNPAQRRPNNGFPTMEMLEVIETAIAEKW